MEAKARRSSVEKWKKPIARKNMGAWCQAEMKTS
jgi:hypothetical protein